MALQHSLVRISPYISMFFKLTIILYSTDINECEAMPPHCEQNCRNTPGSFACSCRLGYSLANNQLSCIGEFTLLYTLYMLTVCCPMHLSWMTITLFFLIHQFLWAWSFPLHILFHFWCYNTVWNQCIYRCWWV